VSVIAPSPDLQITLSNDHGISISATPSRNSDKTYNYMLCTKDTTPGPYPVIEGSNGGTGIVVPWTMTITNQTAKTIRSITALLQTGPQGSSIYSTGCPGAPW